MIDTKDIIGWAKEPRNNDGWEDVVEKERRRKNGI